MRFLYLKLIYSKCLKQAILLLCVTVSLKTHINAAKDLLCQNIQQKEDIMTTQYQNTTKH